MGEKSRVHGAIGFGFASHWLKNWRESFKPIIKRSNSNQIITFLSHLKTAVSDFPLTWFFRGGSGGLKLIRPRSAGGMVLMTKDA